MPTYHLIAAHDSTGGIGKNNTIPWKCSSDMLRFKSLTLQHSWSDASQTSTGNKSAVIMGLKTWQSLPKKLDGRMNIVLSSTAQQTGGGVYVARTWDDVEKLLEKHAVTDVYFCGGARIYEEAMCLFEITHIHLTEIMGNFKCDVFFPALDLKKYDAVTETVQNDNGVISRYKHYELRNTSKRQKTENSDEQAYLDLSQSVLSKGTYRVDRTAVGTYATFGNHLEFDISNGRFPLFTTKKMNLRIIAEELFFFLSGKSDVKLLQNKNVHIWDGNSSRQYLDSIGHTHRREGDIGKAYGFQWRHWGTDYVDCDTSYEGKGVDQIAYVIDLIKRDPTSRRILFSGWNVADLGETALPCCHVLYQFFVENGTLSCSMYQRSADLFLGVPFNIASVALLTYLIAKTCDLAPNKIRLTFGDTHIYQTHLAQVYTQIQRKPGEAPRLFVNTRRDKVEDYVYEDLELSGYQCQGALSGKMAV